MDWIVNSRVSFAKKREKSVHREPADTELRSDATRATFSPLSLGGSLGRAPSFLPGPRRSESTKKHTKPGASAQ